MPRVSSPVYLNVTNMTNPAFVLHEKTQKNELIFYWISSLIWDIYIGLYNNICALIQLALLKCLNTIHPRDSIQTWNVWWCTYGSDWIRYSKFRYNTLNVMKWHPALASYYSSFVAHHWGRTLPWIRYLLCFPRLKCVPSVGSEIPKAIFSLLHSLPVYMWTHVLLVFFYIH